MGFWTRLLGRKHGHAQERISRLQSATREQTRQELIAVALRDTLRSNGLAPGCITAEGLPTAAAGRPCGMHIQMVLCDGHPGMLAYVVALESAVKDRLQRLDPLSPSWVTGLSWRFEPREPGLWPQLPLRGMAGSAAAARPAARTMLHSSLHEGDTAFRARSGRHADFHPTLPMNEL